MNDLAGMFEYGVGVPKNLPTALEWYERAAEFGHDGAMTHMAQPSEDGLEILQDFANARHWYEKAATLGNAASMNNLADSIDTDGDWPWIYLPPRTGILKQPNWASQVR